MSIEIQPRDIELLEGLFESRVMTLAHIAAIHFDDKPEAAKKRVQKLKGAGFIAERPRRARDAAVHFLTKKAFGVLRESGHLAGYPELSASSMEKRAQVAESTLRHELEVMDVKAAFVRAVRGRPSLRLAEFSTWPLLYEFRAYRPTGEAVTVKPDGFIRIREEDANSASEHTFFLEVDRSTETLATLTTRAACYLDFYKRGGLAERNGRPASEFKEFPFRVLMVLKSQERCSNLSQALLAMRPPIRTQVYIATIDNVKNDPLNVTRPATQG